VKGDIGNRILTSMACTCEDAKPSMGTLTLEVVPPGDHHVLVARNEDIGELAPEELLAIGNVFEGPSVRRTQGLKQRKVSLSDVCRSQ
jgi:hypothetical protein